MRIKGIANRIQNIFLAMLMLLVIAVASAYAETGTAEETFPYDSLRCEAEPGVKQVSETSSSFAYDSKRCLPEVGVRLSNSATCTFAYDSRRCLPAVGVRLSSDATASFGYDSKRCLPEPGVRISGSDSTGFSFDALRCVPKPVVTSYSPAGYTNSDVSTLTFELTKNVVVADANDAATYLLLNLGADRQPGGDDDVVVPVVPSYIENSIQIELQCAGPEVLAEGTYQITIKSGDPGIRDADGVFLDGNNDGFVGDDFVATFTVDQTAPVLNASDMRRGQIDLTFCDASGLDETAVENKTIYHLTASGGDGTFGDGNERNVTGSIAGAAMETGTEGCENITLSFSSNMINDLYRLTITGADFKDRAGNPLPEDMAVDLQLNAAVVALDLQEASDSGISSDDNITNVTEPTFDVTVNKAGAIDLDTDGDGEGDVGFTAPDAGTYALTAPALPDGLAHIHATFKASADDSAEATLQVTIDTVAPSLIPGVAQETAPLYQRTVAFSEPLDDSQTTDTLPAVSFIGPGGQDVLVYIDHVSGGPAQYTINFNPPLVQPGTYTLTGAATLRDVAGNVVAEAPVDSFELLADTTPPRIATVTPMGPTNADVSQLSVSFSEAIDAGSFDGSDVAISGPAGEIAQAQITVAQAPGNDRTFVVTISTQTTEGHYDVTLGPDITDLAGNAMAAPYTTFFSIDKTAPQVAQVTPSGTQHAAINAIEVGFDSEIDAKTLSAADVHVQAPDGSAVGVSNPSVVADAANTYRFSTQTPLHTNGTYSVTVGPNVSDPAGNSMAEAFSSSFEISLPDLHPVASVAPPTTGSFGDTLTIAWNDENLGTYAAAGSWSDELWLSASGSIDANAVCLSTAGIPAETQLQPGTSTAVSVEAKLPLTRQLEAGTYTLIVRTDVTSAVKESDEGNNTLVLGQIDLARPPLCDLQPTDVAGPSSVAPGQTVQVSWSVTNPADISVEGQWTEKLYLADAADASKRRILLATVAAADTIDPHATSAVRRHDVQIPAAGAGGDMVFLVMADTADDILETDETNNTATCPTNVATVLTVTLDHTQIAEDAADPRVLATVTRSGDTSAALYLTFATSDDTELTVPATALIPVGSSGGHFYLHAVNDQIIDADAAVTVTVSAPGYPDATATVTVLNAQNPPLTLTLGDGDLTQIDVTEGDTITATVSRGTATESPLTVKLTASVRKQLEMPSDIVIGAGKESAQFAITAVDDSWLENTTAVTVTAQAAGHDSAGAVINVLDNDVPTLSLDLGPAWIAEGAGSLMATVRRAQPGPIDIAVNLTSSDPTQASVPNSIVIPAGQTQAHFYIAPVDDQQQDGSQQVIISASAVIPSCGCSGDPANTVTGELTVLDNDGPSLSLELYEAIPFNDFDGTATVTVRCSETLSADLTVNLASNNPTFLDMPEQVVIAAEAGEATFAVNWAAAGPADVGVITASASGYADAKLTLPILPDLIISAISAPQDVLTEQQLQISYDVANRGLTPATAHNTEKKFSQWVFLSGDDKIGDDTLVGIYGFEDTLPPTHDGVVGIQRTVTTWAPVKPGQYWVVVTTDAADDVTEGNETNNTRISIQPITVRPAYRATVQTGTETAVVGPDTVVLLSGQALATDTGLPVPNVQVNVHIMWRGTTRKYSAFTNDQGQYQMAFRPAFTEGGHYAVGAVHPGVDQAEVQDEFTLVNLQAQPPSAVIDVAENDSTQLSLDISNLSDVDLTGFGASVLGVPGNLSVNLDAGAETLPGLETRTIPVSIHASDASVTQADLTLRFTTAEGAACSVPVTVHVRALRPHLIADTQKLVAAMVRPQPGQQPQQRTLEFTVSNDGGAATGQIAVQLPDVAWLSTPTPTLDPIQPGGSAKISVVLTPGSDMQLTQYPGSIVLVDPVGAALAIPFDFRAVGSGTGNLAVAVVDEYYYYTQGAPKVAGAHVTLSDLFTGQQVSASDEDGDGSINFSNILEGYYEMEVTAEKHASDRRTIFIEPSNNSQLVFLTFEAVHYDWTVEEKQMEDRYDISIESEFETNVPAPVLTVTPAAIDLSPLKQPGDRMEVDLTIENHGLIQAENVRLPFGHHPALVFEPLIDNLGTVPAKSLFKVPVIIRRVEREPGPVVCALSAWLDWSYRTCESVVVNKTTQILLYNIDLDECTAPSSPVPFIGGGGGGGGLVPDVHMTPIVITPPPCGVCARVTLQINQEAVLARDAFEATLQLENNTDGDLTDISLEIALKTADDVAANDLFAILPPVPSTLPDALPQTTQKNSWTLVPSTEAAADGSTVYYVGGTLHYVQDGTQVTVPLTPVPITVLPQPELYLNYFLERDVFSDDPWTDDVMEPAVPFQLAVMIQNKGKGLAHDFHITSAQPKIIDNQQGLLIDFKIRTSEVNGQNMSPSLTANFGDIGPGATDIGRWWLTSTLHGHFIDYNVSFSHRDELGGERVSLIKDVSIHELIHTVWAQGSFDDGKPDFLVNEVPDDQDLPDLLYFSDGTSDVVSSATGASWQQVADSDPNGLAVQVTANMPANWCYLRMLDPGSSQPQGKPGPAEYRLVRVVRSDGKDLTVQDPSLNDVDLNFWQTDRTFLDEGQRPLYEDNVHLLDYNDTGSNTCTYTFYYQPRDQVGPSVMELEQPQDMRQTTVDDVQVTFSEGVKELTPAALSLTLNGGANLIDQSVSVTKIDDRTFTINLPSDLTASSGVYRLTVAASVVQDLYGNAGSGSQTVQWRMLAGAPNVLAINGPKPYLNYPLDGVEVVFTEPVTGFDATSLSLTHDGQPITSLASHVSITQVRSDGFTVTGLSSVTAPEGAYELTVTAENVQDLTGTAGAGSLAAAWTHDATAPEAAAAISITPDTGISAVDGITSASTVTLRGSLSEPGLTVEIFDTTSDRDLGTATVQGQSFSSQLTFSQTGLHRLRIWSIDAAENIADAAYEVTIDKEPPTVDMILLASSDSAKAGDGITNVSDPEFAGDAAPGDKISVQVAGPGGYLIRHSVEANDQGKWWFNPVGSGLSSPLADGEYTVTAYSSDPAGNRSADRSVTVRVDASAPTSKVEPLEAEVAPVCLIKWAVDPDDASPGSFTYDVFVARDGGAYTIWQSGTTERSAYYHGDVGSTYAFYCVATDAAGNIEAKTPVPEASAAIVRAWATPGDVTMDCQVNILDLIAIRNRLNQNVDSSDNWRADVNGDGKINIVDLIYVRNRLNNGCK